MRKVLTFAAVMLVLGLCVPAARADADDWGRFGGYGGYGGLGYGGGIGGGLVGGVVNSLLGGYGGGYGGYGMSPYNYGVNSFGAVYPSYGGYGGYGGYGYGDSDDW